MNFSKNRKREEQNQKKDDSAVIYLGRIPHGFYEDEMRKYFSQFGEVKNLRLSRNKVIFETRERESLRERERVRERERESVCVCVCRRKTKKKREIVCQIEL